MSKTTDLAQVIAKSVVLDEETLAIVEQLVDERKFGAKGFSLGIRTIIREWAEQRKLESTADQITRRALDRQYEHFVAELGKVPELEFPHGNDQGAPELEGD